MNVPSVEEFAIKERRVVDFLSRFGYDAIIIGTTANFAWATCGGDSRVLLDVQEGVCLLVFTSTRKVCVANRMDALRIQEQELGELGFEVVSLKWFERPIGEYALDLVQGRILSDVPLPGAECDFSKFFTLHYPLTDFELERYRSLGADAEEAVVAVADHARPGLSGTEIARAVTTEFANRDMDVSCRIIGIDAEISRYRHPIAWDLQIERRLMLVLAGKRHGLNVPITRLIQFGAVDEEIARRYEAVSSIEARTILSCKPGASFYEISQMQKGLYRELGYEKEWEEHFVGGITGYVANHAAYCTDRAARMTDRQSFNWYVTITGVNVEETMIINGNDQELLTVNGMWPTAPYSFNGKSINLPRILIKE